MNRDAAEIWKLLTAVKQVIYQIKKYWLYLQTLRIVNKFRLVGNDVIDFKKVNHQQKGIIVLQITKGYSDRPDAWEFTPFVNGFYTFKLIPTK